MEGQKKLFEAVKNKIPEHFKLAEVVEELLGISLDAAYRRIRGEKELSFTELQKLCGRFNLSMDEILNYQSNRGALFQYTAVNLNDQESYIRYIERLSETLSNLKYAPDKELYFTAQDIPFYHFLGYPELLFFKLYAWNDTVSKTHISYGNFCEKLDRDTIMPIYGQMANAYMQIPSVEIWTNQTVETILRLLDYYFEIGAFAKKETILLLLNQLMQLLKTIHKYAEDGYKSEKRTPYSLYLCSVDLENNFMLTKSSGRLACNIKLFTVNSIATDNEALCAETEKWINDLISKSILISGASVKERFKFFQVSRNRIDTLISKVEAN
jgi:hypothetical protein